MIVDFARCQVQTPDGPVHGRFLFRAGTAAVWEEDKSTKTAKRILYATNTTFTKAPNGRLPHTVSFPGTDEVWEIRQRHGGCGCGSSPYKGVDFNLLLQPDVTSIP